jgi:hypothetical protein
MHRYCTVYNGDGSLSMYIDGVLKWSVTAPNQAEVNRPMMGLIVQCALRRPTTETYKTAPNFTSGSRQLVVRSVATYTNKNKVGENVQNPGVVTGTVVK